MLIEQTVPSTTFSNPLRALVAACSRTARQIRDMWEEARYRRVVAKLPPHLRYDIGAIDYRPALPVPAAETLNSQKETLETMWPPYC